MGLGFFIPLHFNTHFYEALERKCREKKKERKKVVMRGCFALRDIFLRNGERMRNGFGIMEKMMYSRRSCREVFQTKIQVVSKYKRMF